MEWKFLKKFEKLRLQAHALHVDDAQVKPLILIRFLSIIVMPQNKRHENSGRGVKRRGREMENSTMRIY